MQAFWQQCEGQIVDGFPLRKYLGGDDDHAVFLTEYGGEIPRRAAIKLIHADPDTTESELRRWRLAAELSHPNLIRLFERGHWQLNKVPLLYLVMEYADEDLSQVIPQRALTIEETRQMLDPALSALEYLHAKGFVHGHLKPSNFMAVGDELKLSSDGVANAADGVTQAGDVWSLGVTLVEALTQRAPASPKEATLPETTPPELREIVRNTLQQDPRSRWTVAQIQERLRGGPARVRQRQLTAAVVGMVLLLLAMVAGIKLIHREEAPTSQVLPQPAPVAQAPGSQPRPQTQPPPRPPAQPEAKQSIAPAPRGEVVHEVLPEILPRARNSIHGRVPVTVRVEVDPSGNVTSAALESRGPSQYFAERALEAAQRWKFAPADGPRVWLLRFQFTRAGTKVAPSKTTP